MVPIQAATANGMGEDGQRMKILKWLSPLQPQKRHQDVRSMRLNNTGGWLLNDERFTAWCAGGQGLGTEDRVLCFYGMPGAGKTVIWWALPSWHPKAIYLACKLKLIAIFFHQLGGDWLPPRRLETFQAKKHSWGCMFLLWLPRSADTKGHWNNW